MGVCVMSFLFFKQKTAYEMRISDWSSDVCSSDLRRQGRFAATVEPKMVQLDQNRVDIVFEISEGPKSKVRQINIIGNEKFKDGELRSQMVTKQSRWFRIFSSGTSYDPDRLAYDQQMLRQFYLTEGYADFRVISAVAELTPDKQDLILRSER